jgi:hypothetical protein
LSREKYYMVVILYRQISDYAYAKIVQILVDLELCSVFNWLCKLAEKQICKITEKSK